MGSWFANIHIRKTERITEASVAQCVAEMMAAKHYLPVLSKEEADGAFAIVSGDDSSWLCVCADLFSFEDSKSFTEYAAPMSETLGTDVLGIACFDSDYLYMNLINAEEKVDAWIGIGSAAGLGIKRRSGLTAWKNKVTDYASFSAAAKKKYVFAEAFLQEIEAALDLSVQQASAAYEYLEDLGLGERARYLYFKLADDRKTKEPARLVPRLYSGMPCFLGKPSIVDGINVGGESKGLSVYFVGSYVEKDEITFSDVCLKRWKNGRMEYSTVALKKVQLPDGQWAYCCHDPEYRIPGKVDDRLPMRKRLETEHERSIAVRFVPQGDPRKILDITVILVPDKNPEGQTGWNVWHRWGSKEAFIAQFNETWAHLRQKNIPSCPPLLKAEDFD